MLFPSATDAPLRPFFWPGVRIEELTFSRVMDLVAASEDANVQCVSVYEFFLPALESTGRLDNGQADDVQRFKTLLQVLEETLECLIVFQIGSGELDCYIVGGVDGGCGGLKTRVVGR